ncbi:hypothetical protein JKF63_06326 [Porcisia hertigi]|uniref:Uncharacterized protein n=1 Tax=Porcisia hertigi TaxID=2761500 RepID=A0A836IX34_9TRYP|nr:hypothetical protein JKF63_06326 [Porcisia hertigi]
MNRHAFSVSSSADDIGDVLPSPAARAGNRATSGTPVTPPAEDLLPVGTGSHPHTSSDDSVRSSTSAVQLPESTKVTATRRNLSELFGASPVPLTAPVTARSQGQSSATQAAAAGGGERDASLESDKVTMNTAAFFAPRFDYNSSASMGAKRGAAALAAVMVATNEVAPGLITAEYAFVQAYRDTLYSGTSAPLSVASHRHPQYEKQEAGAASNAPASSPTLLLISSNRQVLCRVALDATDAVFSGESLRLRQDVAQPQYLTFDDDGHSSIHGGSSSRKPLGSRGSGCWWTCMFADRDMASRFLVSTYTVAQYAAVLAKITGATSASAPSVRTLPAYSSAETDKAMSTVPNDTQCVARPDVPATIWWQTWALRRVSSQTLYYLPGTCLEAVPPSSPRSVAATDGAILGKAAAAVVGMRSGESRLVFLTPEDLRAWKPRSRADSGLSDRLDSDSIECDIDSPAVIYMTCVQVASSPINTPVSSTPAAVDDLALLHPRAPSPPPPPAATVTESSVAVVAPQSAAVPSQVPGAVDTVATNALLQQLLLHFLQQPPPQPPSNAPAAHQGPPQEAWESMERTLNRVQARLSSLSEQIDHLDIEGALRRNNTELERVIRKVAGLAPQGDVAIEDALKDREALLASIERYRNRFEEANTNYQRALEAMGPLSDRAQALERDLHLQQDLWAKQRRDEAEQMRLRLVERDARHRDDLERVGEERYAAGRSEGHAEGYQEGRQATLLELEGNGTDGVAGSVVAQWRAKLMARDQEVSALQTALQEARLRHERDRAQLRAEIDVLSELKEKLEHLQANADVRVPEETVQQQCKRVKRILNAVYSKVEGELLQLSSFQELRVRSCGSRPLPPGGEGMGIEEAREAVDGGGSDGRVVAVDDVLAIVMEAIRSEAQAAVLQIRSIEAQRTAENAELRGLTASRQIGQHPTWTSYHDYRSSTPSAFSVGQGMEREGRGPVVEGSTVSNHASMTPPPVTPVRTAASQGALTAMETQIFHQGRPTWH